MFIPDLLLHRIEFSPYPGCKQPRTSGWCLEPSLKLIMIINESLTINWNFSAFPNKTNQFFHPQRIKTPNLGNHILNHCLTFYTNTLGCELSNTPKITGFGHFRPSQPWGLCLTPRFLCPLSPPTFCRSSHPANFRKATCPAWPRTCSPASPTSLLTS